MIVDSCDLEELSRFHNGCLLRRSDKLGRWTASRTNAIAPVKVQSSVQEVYEGTVEEFLK